MNDENVKRDGLLQGIRRALVNEQSIIPVIGYDAIPVRIGNTTVPYLDYLSGKLIEDHLNSTSVDPTLEKSTGFDLFNFVTHKLLEKNRFNQFTTTTQISEGAKKIHALVDISYLEKIVAIFPFRYFLNLTFTNHLSEVIKIHRTFPKIGVRETTFPFIIKNPKRPEDIQKSDCVFVGSVYHLFGKAYAGNDEILNYYYSDHDLLSFIAEFNKRYDIDLKNYKEILQDASLLFLGCQYPDWLLRVVINTLSPGSLDFRDSRQTKIFVDYCSDNSTIFFLEKHNFQYQESLQTQFFVNDLYSELAQKKLAIDINSKNDFAFISYTRDDLEVVRKIVCQLSPYLALWFDKTDLFPGDQINTNIKKAIDNCKLFLPIITKNNCTKPESAYVRQEWLYYHENFRNNAKVIPLVAKDVNLGALGFDLDTNFSTPGSNLFHIHFDENGLQEENITDIRKRLNV